MAWNVTVSSCVIGSTNSRSFLSRSLNTSGIEYLPVAFQSSAGVRTGIEISCEPIASISSRMIWTIFSCTRQPSGRKVHTPALTWRRNAPRTSSL